MAKTNGAIAASTASVEQLIRDRLGVEPAFDPTYLRSANSAPCEVPPAPAPIQAVGGTARALR